MVVNLPLIIEKHIAGNIYYYLFNSFNHKFYFIAENNDYLKAEYVKFFKPQN